MAYQPKSYRKFVATTATAAMVASAVAPVVSAASFTDVAPQYKDAIDFLVSTGATKGKTETKFGVYDEITRLDAAVILARVLKLDVDNAKDAGFTDVPKDRAKYVNALVEAGVLNGKAPGKFGAYDPLTRVEMAKIIANAYNLKGDDVKLPFTDVNDTWAPYVKALYKYEVTKGKTPTSFGAYQNITRGDFAQFVYRAANVNVAPQVVSVSAITTTKVKVTFNKEIEGLTRDSFTIKNKATGEKQYVKAVTVATDKKSAEIELYDALKSKTTYSIDVKVGDQTLNAELDFVIGEVAQIIAEDQTIPAKKETAIKYQVLDTNGLDITADTKVSFASDKNITDGKITLDAGEFAFVEISATKADGTVVKSKRIKVAAEAAKAVDMPKFTVADGQEVDWAKDTLTNKVRMGTTPFLKAQFKDQFGGDYTGTVEFESLDKEVALVDRVTGKITPLKEGKLPVRIKNGDFTKTVELEVVAASKLTSLSVENSTLNVTTVKPTGTVKITALDQYGNKFNAGEATVKVLSGAEYLNSTPSVKDENNGEYTLTVTGKAEGTAVVEVTIGTLKQNITVNVKKPGTAVDYNVKGFKAELDKVDDKSTTDDETKMVLEVYPVDANGLETDQAVKSTVKVYDQDNKEVEKVVKEDDNRYTIDATDSKFEPGKTYTVKVLVNNLEVFSNTFTVKDSTKYPTLRLTASTVEIDIDGEDNTLEAALEKILEVTAPNGTLASKATVLDVEFVSDNESVIVDKGNDKSSPTGLGNATVAISEVKIDLDGDTSTETDQYKIKFNSNLNVVVVDRTAPTATINHAVESFGDDGKLPVTTVKFSEAVKAFTIKYNNSEITFEVKDDGTLTAKDSSGKEVPAVEITNTAIKDAGYKQYNVGSDNIKIKFDINTNTAYAVWTNSASVEQIKQSFNDAFEIKATDKAGNTSDDLAK
uniref:S-layer domain protein n=1 Tax=Geobacillus sp. (strain WCH70) TaxID=471223 RepID=C5D8D3_GEOSW